MKKTMLQLEILNFELDEITEMDFGLSPLERGPVCSIFGKKFPPKYMARAMCCVSGC